MQPYSNIMAAEANHVAAMQNALKTHGVAYPANHYLGKITAPGTVLEAAQAGVDEEQANVAMYDRLIIAIKAYPNLVRVMTNLRTASLKNHLPPLRAPAAVLSLASPGLVGYHVRRRVGTWWKQTTHRYGSSQTEERSGCWSRPPTCATSSPWRRGRSPTAWSSAGLNG
ncbi:MAG: hypothetical protein NT029_07275 [Armatimonadetes bacterium]|nr:hypothetical protein [Armatimonadota bacterium]